jgi:hypothetical protein
VDVASHLRRSAGSGTRTALDRHNRQAARGGSSLRSRARVLSQSRRADRVARLEPARASSPQAYLHTPNVATASAFDMRQQRKARADLQCSYGHSADIANYCETV